MFETAAGFPLPRLSRGRFPYPGADAEKTSSICAYTDDDLFGACGVRIAFTERAGGFGSGAFESLDMGDRGNGGPQTGRRNRELALACLGFPDARIIVPHQVHGTDIVDVDDPAPQAVEATRVRAKEGADAVMVGAGISGVAALLRFADCMPVIIAAPGGTFCVVHAGWRGVVAHIAPKALRHVCDVSGAAADRCNIYIGPYIHGECFEVGDDVHERFTGLFGGGCAPDERHIDMGAAMRTDLLREGAALERIADVGACTVCANDRFFSYRAQQGVCGRHGAVAVRSAAGR